MEKEILEIRNYTKMNINWKEANRDGLRGRGDVQEYIHFILCKFLIWSMDPNVNILCVMVSQLVHSCMVNLPLETRLL